MSNFELQSRWTCPIPDTDIASWLFGDAGVPLSTTDLYFDAEKPRTHHLSLLTYRSLTRRIAKGWKSVGLQDGDRVLVFSANNVFYPSMYVGIISAGGIFTGANPSFTARELAFQLGDSGARFCVANEASIDTALIAAAEIGMPKTNVINFDDSLMVDGWKWGPRKSHAVRHWSELVAEDEDFKWKVFATREEANKTAAINYSSGTTGVPKGVEITHRNLIANSIQVMATMNMDPERSKRDHRWIGVLPMYHAYGQTFYVMIVPAMAVQLYIMPKFDFPRFLTVIQAYRITNIAVGPPILTALVKHPIVTKFDISSIRNISSGAAPLAVEIAKELEGKLNIRVKQGWGMTETTCSVLGFHPLDDTGELGSTGELNPNCEAKIVDPEDVTTSLPANTRGELLVRAPNICKGYYKNPKATAEAFTPDGWLRTGDIAYVTPQGKFYIVDRMKELIKVKGNQVAPAELENVLLENVKIQDAAVIGVPKGHDEAPRAYVVKAIGATLNEEEVFNWVRERAVRYKWLTGGVKFVDAIPKNPSGKVLRKVIREWAAKERTSKL